MDNLVEARLLLLALELRRRADRNRALQAHSPTAGCPLPCALADYRAALFQQGPLAPRWTDAPEKLMCELIAAVTYWEARARDAERQTAPAPATAPALRY